MAAAGYKVIITSGRSGAYRSDLQKWLTRKGISYDCLYMREEDDMRRDDIIKEEFLDNINCHYKVTMAIDDRDAVVAMWRRRGIPCHQVAPGNF